MTPLRIQTAGRLHFGLLGWGPQTRRQFGGIGLMIERPELVLLGRPSSQNEASGRLSERVRVILDRIETQFPADFGQAFHHAAIQVKQAPNEHEGFGVGTQLSLAVARLALALSGIENPSVEQLARLSERGRRSGIGLHGFLHGGLIVDGGHHQPSDVPPLLSRMDFPEEWSILIVRPPGTRGRHGPEEVKAFAELPPISDRTTERLCRLVLLDLLPAVAERDLVTFGAALSELQLRVGTAFAQAQGGIYASRLAETLIEDFKTLGLSGGGQSSWGPSLYAFGVIPPEERLHITQWLSNRRDLDLGSLIWTRAFNHGATLEKTTKAVH